MCVPHYCYCYKCCCCCWHFFITYSFFPPYHCARFSFFFDLKSIHFFLFYSAQPRITITENRIQHMHRNCGVLAGKSVCTHTRSCNTMRISIFTNIAEWTCTSSSHTNKNAYCVFLWIFFVRLANCSNWISWINSVTGLWNGNISIHSVRIWVRKPLNNKKRLTALPNIINQPTNQPIHQLNL